jgi:hypothetical protein
LHAGEKIELGTGDFAGIVVSEVEIESYIGISFFLVCC